MGNTIKIWLIVGTSLIVLGLMIFAVVMQINHWDWGKLSTAKYVTNTYPIDQDFTDISVVTDTADILFVPSDTQQCSVVCYEQENAQHSVSVQDGCLTVRINQDLKWYDHIGINFGAPKLTVTLPRGAYRSIFVECSTGNTVLPKEFSFESIHVTASTGDATCYADASEDMKLRVSTGDIRVAELSAGSMELSVSTGHVTASDIRCAGPVSIGTSTGKVSLCNVTCDSLTSTGSTGKLIAKNVTVTQSLSVTRSTGDVTLDQCDAAQLRIKTGTGDVTGSLLTDKVFITQTGTGRVEVPKTGTGGRCEITTGTGDIKITVAE